VGPKVQKRKASTFPRRPILNARSGVRHQTKRGSPICKGGGVKPGALAQGELGIGKGVAGQQPDSNPRRIKSQSQTNQAKNKLLSLAQITGKQGVEGQKAKEKRQFVDRWWGWGWEEGVVSERHESEWNLEHGKSRKIYLALNDLPA